MDLSGSSLHTPCTYRIYYSTISFLYFICNDFSHFYYLLSQLFGFSSAIFFSISIYCGFTFFYHYAALVVPFCTWLCFSAFLSHFWCRNLFLVRITPFLQPWYISVYRLLFCLKNLRCLCVVTSWFATITFPVSAYIDSLCARTSMLVDPQHQYIVFFKQFLKGGFYTGKFEHLLPQRSPAAAKGGFYTRGREILVSLLPCFYAYYPNSSAGVFRCLCKERFLHRKISYRTLHLCLHGNALPLSQKRDFRPAQFVAATGSIQKKIWKQRFFHGKKRFLHAYLADWAVAISFYSLLNLLHPVWKSLSPSVFPLRWHVETSLSTYYNK